MNKSAVIYWWLKLRQALAVASTFYDGTIARVGSTTYLQDVGASPENNSALYSGRAKGFATNMWLPIPVVVGHWLYKFRVSTGLFEEYEIPALMTTYNLGQVDGSGAYETEEYEVVIVMSTRLTPTDLTLLNNEPEAFVKMVHSDILLPDSRFSVTDSDCAGCFGLTEDIEVIFDITEPVIENTCYFYSGTGTVNLTVNIAAGETIVFNWGDGTSTTHNGTNTDTTISKASGASLMRIEISDPSKLYYIDFGGESLHGTIPDWSQLVNNTRMLLYNNQLTGTIPDWSQLVNNTTMSLYSNQLTGTIPDWSQLVNNIYMYLYSNQLTGAIPDWSQLVNNTRMYLQSNQLTGTIPDWSQLVNNTTMSLYNNQLTGTIPDWSQLVNNTRMLLYNNQLTGTIPDWSQLVNNTTMSLYSNQLTGYAGGVIHTSTEINISSNNIDQAGIDLLIQGCVDGNKTGVILKLQDGTNAAPSAAGLLNVAILQGRGWTVTHN